MKASLLHRPNFTCLLLGFLVANHGFVFAEEKTSSFSELLKTKYQNKSYRQWINYVFPYVAPTEAELKEQLKNDPQWGAFYSSEISTPQAPLPEQSLPAVSETSRVPAKLVSTKPEGALMAVRIPKGMSLPSSPTGAIGQQPIVEPRAQGSVGLTKPTASAPSITPVTGGPIIQEEAPSSPVAEKIQQETPYIGIWTGQYQKLIEYYDPATETWKASENSLRDIPVELKLDEKGLLTYKMPEREGTASYVFKNEVFSIICEDIRVRGDYSILEHDAQKFNFQMSRVLVKDKMRTSMEFRLTRK
jgi:hypothetical protein